jgi:hypothetical protein
VAHFDHPLMPHGPYRSRLKDTALRSPPPCAKVNLNDTAITGATYSTRGCAAHRTVRY